MWKIILASCIVVIRSDIRLHCTRYATQRLHLSVSISCERCTRTITLVCEFTVCCSFDLSSLLLYCCIVVDVQHVQYIWPIVCQAGKEHTLVERLFGFLFILLLLLFQWSSTLLLRTWSFCLVGYLYCWSIRWCVRNHVQLSLRVISCIGLCKFPCDEIN